MAYPSYIREKAIQLRVEKQLTLTEIAARLAIPKTTIYYWINHLPRPEHATSRPGFGSAAGSAAMQDKYARLRREAYQRGAREFDDLAGETHFRDFVVLFIAEGTKRNRHGVSIANSHPAVIRVVDQWLKRLADKSPVYSIQYHADQDLPQLQEFWARLVDAEAGAIRLQRKSNSNQLKSRSWRSEHGVLTVTVHDTYLRERMQAWTDRVTSAWLDSDAIGA